MTIVLAVVIGSIGLLLSAFFGGTETGFYRISRIRVQLDAVEGNRLAQWLLHLFNHPSLFIATILLGNNIANYAVSSASVILVQAVFATTGNSAEILATLLLTPFLFVYGEMFPKYVFMQIPEQAFRYALPLFFVFLVLLLPISLVIWLFHRGFAFLLGEKSEPLQKRLARRELVKRFDEGQEHGILLPSQRQLTRNVFNVASQSILHSMTPISHYPAITLAMSPAEMSAMAKQYELAEFPVFAATGDQASGIRDQETGSNTNPEVRSPKSEACPLQPVGYVRTIELALALQVQSVKLSEENNSTLHTPHSTLPIRELIEIDDDHSPLNVMLLFQASNESLGMVIRENGAGTPAKQQCLGLISEKRLMNVLFSGEVLSGRSTDRSFFHHEEQVQTQPGANPHANLPLVTGFHDPD